LSGTSPARIAAPLLTLVRPARLARRLLAL